MELDLSKKTAIRRPSWIPYYALGLVLAIALLATYCVAITADAKDRLRFENAVVTVDDEIEKRLDTYIALLRAGSGLFAASDRVSSDEFRAFVDALQLRQRYPGIQGIGFSARVTPEEKQALIANMRSQGIENFTIKPDYKRPEYHAITYIEPLDRRNQVAIGYDMSTEPERRAAMERAAATGTPAATGRITLVQEIDARKQAGFLICVPIYRKGVSLNTVAERQAALEGFVYGAFRAGDLMEAILSSQKNSAVDLEIYDGTVESPSARVYSSRHQNASAASTERPRFRVVKTLDVAGRPWRIAFTSRPELDRGSDLRLLPYIWLIALPAAAASFGVTRSFLRARHAARRSTAALRQSRKALRESESRLKQVVDANIIGVVLAEEQGQIVEANDAFLNMLGYDRQDLLAGKLNFISLTPPEYRALDEQAREEMKRSGSHKPFEKEYIRKDGTRVPVLVGTAHLGGAEKLGVGFLLDLSEQKRAKESLQRSEIRFRTSIEQSPLSTQILSPDGRTVQVNKAWEELWGMTKEQLGDRNILFDEQLAAKGVMPYIKKAFAGEAAAIPPILYESEPNSSSSSPSRRWVQSRIYPVKDEADNIREVVILHEDITARKQAEDRFRRLFDSNSIGVAFWRGNGCIFDANDAFLELAGYTRAEFAATGGLSWKALTPPEYEAVVFEAIARARAAGVSEICEKECLRRTGDRISVVFRVALLDESQTEGVFFLLDITERKKAEQALKTSEERFRKLAEKVRVIPWEADAITWRYLYVGPQAVQILGYPLEEWYAENFWISHLHPEDRDRAIAFYTDAAAHPQDCEYEYRMLAADGQVVWVCDIVSAVRDEKGLKLWRGITLDVTERKRVEAERIQLLRRERTAREQAEAANRLKDEFLATLSHELRTPLTATIGWTTLLKHQKFDEATTARALDTIDRNTKALSQLIDELLDVSRIVTGKFRLEMVAVELPAIIEAAIEAVRSAAEAKNIQIHTCLDLQVGLVSGDMTRLQQIVWNLLSNAIKFTPKGGHVSIGLDRNHSNARIIVSDTGQGISAEFLPHIFERFRQADSAMTRTHGGLGLGLAIVRHLVELHGGSICAESLGEDRGATFAVELPLLDENNNRTRAAQEEEKKHFAPSPYLPLEGLRVLIVDDEADARDLLTTVLTDSGAEVMAVASASVAFKIIARSSNMGRPDILISDIGMPGEDGFSLIRKVRLLSKEEGGEIPSIALTAYARATERSRVLSAGFQLHIAKPVVPDELVRAIASLTGRTACTLEGFGELPGLGD